MPEADPLTEREEDHGDDERHEHQERAGVEEQEHEQDHAVVGEEEDLVASVFFPQEAIEHIGAEEEREGQEQTVYRRHTVEILIGFFGAGEDGKERDKPAVHKVGDIAHEQERRAGDRVFRATVGERRALQVAPEVEADEERRRHRREEEKPEAGVVGRVGFRPVERVEQEYETPDGGIPIEGVELSE